MTHEQFVKVNKQILTDMFEKRKDELKDLAMEEPEDKERDLLIKMYWEYQDYWLPLLEQEKQREQFKGI